MALTRTEDSILEEVARHVAQRLHAQYRSGGIALDHIPARGHDATKRLLSAAFGGSRRWHYAVTFESSNRIPYPYKSEDMSATIADALIQKIGTPLVINFLDLEMPAAVDAVFVCRAHKGGPIVRVLRSFDVTLDKLVYRADVKVEVIGPEANA